MSAVTVGLLHTVPSLAPTFDLLIAAERPELRRVHVADAWLLATTRQDGVTPAVHDTLVAHVRHLAGLGAAAVLVTCSSIGEAADAACEQVDIPVLRVDEPMARQAIALATAAGARGKLAVLATLQSTLGPTRRLVERAARATGRPICVTTQVVPDAAAAADAGDRARCDELVAAAIAKASGDVDAVVLAQASMAAAARAATVPVLSSPEGGVIALLAAVS